MEEVLDKYYSYKEIRIIKQDYKWMIYLEI